MICCYVVIVEITNETIDDDDNNVFPFPSGRQVTGKPLLSYVVIYPRETSSHHAYKLPMLYSRPSCVFSRTSAVQPPDESGHVSLHCTFIVKGMSCVFVCLPTGFA